MVVIATKPEAMSRLEANREFLGVGADGCVMCALASAERQEAILETEHATVTLDRFGNRYGHLLVIPRLHATSLTELDAALYLHLQALCFEASKTLSRVFNPLRVFVAALGSSEDVPMSFPHFHIHVLPILEKGEMARPAKVFSWTEGVVLYDEAEASELTGILREQWVHETTRGLE